MSEITFIEADSKQINSELINGFEKSLGETLYPGDERRIFLQQETQVVVGLKNDINESAKQNLIRYAKEDYLNELGEFFDTFRLEAQKAEATYKFTLSSPRSNSLEIPAGTRVSPDGKLYFEVIESIEVPAESLEALATVRATEPGEKHNGFEPGQISTVVDPFPFLESGTNISVSSGGADLEDDERYRERIREAPRSFSVAGPEGAYKYHAKSVDSTISDVEVISPSPGEVRVILLQKNGVIPEASVISKVLEKLSSRDIRPLTDSVSVVPATAISYDINLTYYLDLECQADELKNRKLIEGIGLDFQEGAIRDYIDWQQEKLGRDISPDDLRYRIQNAVEYMIGGKSYTAVKRIDIISPLLTPVSEAEVGKVGLINVSYGGME